jgi:hypothetical protein
METLQIFLYKMKISSVIVWNEQMKGWQANYLKKHIFFTAAMVSLQSRGGFGEALRGGMEKRL